MAKKFERDNLDDPRAKNAELARLLRAEWNPLKVQKIERFDNPPKKGWEVTHGD